MELKRKCWAKSDILEFNQYLLSLANLEKGVWTKRIYSCQKPCLAIKVPVLKQIAKEIAKGDAISFLKYQTHEYIEDDILTACIISLFKDFDLQQKYILDYLKNVDSWVCTDTLKISENNFEKVYAFACSIFDSKYTFLRRFAFVCLLKFAKKEEYIELIFDLIKKANLEQEYYVNMAISWLICEIMIYFPSKTYKFLEEYKDLYKNANNIFVIKKSISKCRDSFRIDNLLKIKLKELI